MSAKVLSVIVPSYNMEKYLPKCLDSLVIPLEMMEQLEVLVVNDGSKDRTSEIAHEFEVRYPESFKVIDKSNGNYGSCINAALPLVTGRYVRVLDADDYVDTKLFKEFLAALESVDVDLFLTDYDRVDPDGKVLHAVCYNLEKSAERPGLDAIGSQYLEGHAITYRTSNVRAINYIQTEGISYTDQEWAILPMATVGSIGIFNKPVVKYLVGRDGQTMDPVKYARDFWMVEKVSLSVIKKARALNVWANDVARAWMEHRLIEQAVFVFAQVVEGFQGHCVRHQIFAFDEGIRKANPELYANLQGHAVFSRKFRVSFVDELRIHPRRFALTCCLFRFYCKIICVLLALRRI